MSPSTRTVFLVSGANRGIGLGLVKALAHSPSNLVFAGARDPSKADALNALAASHENLKVLKLVSGDAENNKAAVAAIQTEAGRLDTVIANAGIAKHFGPLVSHPASEFRDHFEVNTIGTVVLFQATQPLLAKSPTGAGHFAVISTVGASISNYMPLQAAAYGASKAAVNFLVQVIHQEHESEGIVATAHHPGWVQTEMGNGGAVANGMPAAPIALDESVAGLLSNIVGATRAKSSGKFWNFKVTSGNPWDIPTEEVPW